MEITFVVVWEKKISTCGFGYLIENALQTQFLTTVSYQDEWIVLAVRKRLANDGVLVYACQWRPDSRRRDAREATSFMNDELIWDVTRAVDS